MNVAIVYDPESHIDSTAAAVFNALMMSIFPDALRIEKTREADRVIVFGMKFLEDKENDRETTTFRRLLHRNGKRNRGSKKSGIQ